MFSLALSLMMLAQAAPATGPADVAAPTSQTSPAAPAAPAASATQPTGLTGSSVLPATGPAATGTTGTGTPTTRPMSTWERVIAEFNPFYLIIVVIGLMMFFQVRSRRNQEKAQKEKLNSIKRGDRVQTIGGILGNVVQTEERRILVKVDESNNTKIWFARDAIRGVIDEDKSEARDSKGGK